MSGEYLNLAKSTLKLCLTLSPETLFYFLPGVPRVANPLAALLLSQSLHPEALIVLTPAHRW